MENQPELEDGEIESDVEDIGQTRPVKKLKKNCRDAFIIAEKAAGSWRNLSEYSPNDSPINRMGEFLHSVLTLVVN